MTNSKTTKKALLSSALALTMCVAMLIATTFAWFTDTASTSVNKIQAGNLDVELVKAEVNANGGYDALGDNLYWTQMSKEGGTAAAVTTEGLPLWEPGATYNLESFRIKNNGDLGLKYKIAISGLTGNAKLLEAIDFTVSVDENLVAKDGTTSTVNTLGKLNNFEGKLDAGAVTGKITITGAMKEKAGNEYQGLSIDNIAITVYATQAEGEYDSTTNNYDAAALYDIKINETATGNLPVTKEDESNAIVKTATTIDSGQVSVTYPANVKLKSEEKVTGTTDQKAEVTQKLEYQGSALSSDATSKNIKINAETQTAAQYELTLPVDENNTVLVPVKIEYEKNLKNVVIYHAGVELTKATVAPEGGSSNEECFTYDSDTGILILYLKHASKIDVVFDIPGVTSVATAGELETALKNSEVRIVKLTSDMTLSNNIELTGSKTTTLDMNGKTLTCTAKWGAFDLKGASLKIIGKGEIESSYQTDQSQRVFNVSNKNSTLTIDDVEVNASTDNGFVAVDAGTLIINGGKYTMTNGGAAVFAYGADSKVVINDGTFKGEDKSEGAVYAFNGANVEVKGGQFTFKDEGDVNWTLCDYSQMTTFPFTYGGVKVETAGHISVTGGTFNKDISELPNYKYDGNFGVVKINYVASGYAATKNEGNDTWTVEKK